MRKHLCRLAFFLVPVPEFSLDRLQVWIRCRRSALLGQGQKKMRRIANGVLDLVGKTPLVKLAVTSVDCDLFLKLERCNPGGNVKDRAALNMVLAAEARGDLRPGGTIIESSSGNTGLSLAMIGAARRYPVVIVVDNHVQPEKIALMRAYGATIAHVGRDLPPEQQAGAEREAKVAELLKTIPGAFYVNQGDNLDNQAVHYRTTAEELLSELGSIDYFFASIGTGGTISGTGRRLKEVNSATKVIGVEPRGSIFFGNPYQPFFLTGAGSTKEVWKNIDFDIIDERTDVTDQQAFATCRRVAKATGLLMGGTGGMVVFKMLEYLRTQRPKGCLVGVVPDGGEQYLTSIYDDDWMRRHQLMDAELDALLGRQLQ